MSDQFKQDNERISRTIIQIKNDINQREQKRSLGKSTNMIDAEIRGQICQLTRDIESMGLLIDIYQKEPQKHNLLFREVERRRNIYIQNLNQKNEINQKFENVLLNQQKQKLFNNKQDQGKNYDMQVSGQDNQTMLLNQKAAYEKQNEQLEQINSKISGISENIKSQNKIINNLNDEVDKMNDLMTKTRKKIGKFAEKSSNCCLMMTIIFEIVFLIVIIIV